MLARENVTLADGRRVDADELARLVYDDLRNVAAAFFRHESPGATLQPTALVHEAYMRLADQHDANWQNRAQFLAVAAGTMRRVLIDAARKRESLKRGEGHTHITLLETPGLEESLQIDVLDIEDALEQLGELNERYVRIVELRFFAGLTIDEVGQVLGVSGRMIKNDWAKARAFLQVILDRGGDANSE